jgi:hypothetical protein
MSDDAIELPDDEDEDEEEDLPTDGEPLPHN